MELTTSNGTKLEFYGLSKNKGVVWVKWKDIVNHVLIDDLDELSKSKILKLLEEYKLINN
jgi:hypothetical protein